MKRYEFTLRPLSDFGTPLKGDTLFGCFCWQAAYDESLVEGGLDQALKVYDGKPFAVFSSALLKITDALRSLYVLKRPDMPLARIFPDNGKDRAARYEELKEQKRRRWMVFESLSTLNLKEARFFNGEELHAEFGVRPVSASVRPHNTINRMTLSTGSGAFAPYEMETLSYVPDSTLGIVVLIDEDLTSAEHIKRGLEAIGKFGFGRDAGIGMGRFQVVEYRILPDAMPDETNAIYTLAPCVPESGQNGKCFFTPFVRFGKHGDRLAGAKNPFKNPVVMADEGAVFFRQKEKNFDKLYIGKAVGGISKNQEGAMVQGYTPYIPITLE